MTNEKSQEYQNFERLAQKLLEIDRVQIKAEAVDKSVTPTTKKQKKTDQS